ncbi:MAG: phosphonate ABC transporter, permease protein PhnE [Rhodocyclaceae bacterium]|nr:phosphonate ABC transporter, permease protein PhnE [Rhodocyclaceae bacterium]MDP3031618.1 phosphonate ABC transporter, permease protein PhnE [Rhodocyclaceae bacterium]
MTSSSATALDFEAHYRSLGARKRLVTIAYGTLFLIAFGLSAWVGEFDPLKLLRSLPRVHEYAVKTLPTLSLATLWHDLNEWFYAPGKWLSLLWETILIAYTATLLGTLGALALCFHASQNLRRGSVSYWLVRRIFEVARTIPDLVYALIFVFAFGIGPLAGILAIAVHSMGGSGKLFAETVENIDMKPVEGLRATGANWLQIVRFAVLPQVLPNFATFTLWRFEINVRTASVIGFVGAGGIGQELYIAIARLYYEDISALLLLLVITVMLIDFGCEKLRHAMIGKEHH